MRKFEVGDRVLFSLNNMREYGGVILEVNSNPIYLYPYFVKVCEQEYYFSISEEEIISEKQNSYENIIL